MPSSSPHLLIYPFTHTPSRCWDPEQCAVSRGTIYSIDKARARQLRPNPCHRVFVLSSSTVHVPVHPLARFTMGSKTSLHRLSHLLFVRPGASAAPATQSILFSLPQFFLHRHPDLTILREIRPYAGRSTYPKGLALPRQTHRFTETMPTRKSNVRTLPAPSTSGCIGLKSAISDYILTNNLDQKKQGPMTEKVAAGRWI